MWESLTPALSRTREREPIVSLRDQFFHFGTRSKIKAAWTSVRLVGVCSCRVETEQTCQSSATMGGI